jgi:phosphate transport system ATP-binding protein
VGPDRVTISSDGTSVTITLPPPRLSPATVDPAASRIVGRDRGIVERLADVLEDNPTNDDQLYQLATQKIEDLIYELKQNYTVVIVTHNMQQAARVSDYTAFLYMGDLIEYGPTNTVFTNPREERTESYITGRFG